MGKLVEWLIAGEGFNLEMSRKQSGYGGRELQCITIIIIVYFEVVRFCFN